MPSTIRGGDNFDSADALQEDGSGNSSVTNNFSVGGTITQQSESVPMMKRETAVALNTLRATTFTVPSWAKKITVAWQNVSVNGSTDILLIQVGDAGGIETSGYESGSHNASGSQSQYETTYIRPGAGTGNAANNYHGLATMMVMDAANRTIAGHGQLLVETGAGTGAAQHFAFQKILSAQITQIKFGLTGSTDDFDSGTVNVVFEGY